MPNPPLQIYPKGLLGFYQQKAGRNPGPLGEQLNPEIELLEWYLSSEAESLQGTNQLINAVGNWGTGLQVPDQEFWFLHHFAISAILEAAELFDATLGAVYPNGGIVLPFAPMSAPVGGATVPNAAGVCIGVQPRVFLPPLTSLFINVYRLTTANNVPTTPQVWITRLPT